MRVSARKMSQAHSQVTSKLVSEKENKAARLIKPIIEVDTSHRIRMHQSVPEVYIFCLFVSLGPIAPNLMSRKVTITKDRS